MPDKKDDIFNFDDVNFHKKETGIDRNAKQVLQSRGYLEKDGDFYNYETDQQSRDRQFRTEDSRRDYIKNPSVLKTLGRGFSRGSDNLQSSAYGVVGLFGDLIGSEGMKDFGLKGFTENQREASETYVPIDSFIGADETGAFGSVGNFAQAVPQAIGEALPSILESVGFGIAGGIAGSQAVPGVGPDDIVAAPAGAITGIFAKGAIKNYIKRMAGEKGLSEAVIKKSLTPVLERKIISDSAKSLSAKVGSGLAVGLTESGSNFADLSVNSGIDAPMTSLMFGMLSGASEGMFGASADIMKTFIKSPLTTAVRQQAKKHGMKKAAGWMWDVMKGSAEEGAQEAFQGFLSSLNQEVNDPDFEITSKETFMEWLEQAAAGALVGGPTRGATSLANIIKGQSNNPITETPIEGPGEVSVPSIDLEALKKKRQTRNLTEKDLRDFLGSESTGISESDILTRDEAYGQGERNRLDEAHRLIDLGIWKPSMLNEAKLGKGSLRDFAEGNLREILNNPEAVQMHGLDNRDSFVNYLFESGVVDSLSQKLKGFTSDQLSDDKTQNIMAEAVRKIFPESQSEQSQSPEITQDDLVQRREEYFQDTLNDEFTQREFDEQALNEDLINNETQGEDLNKPTFTEPSTQEDSTQVEESITVPENETSVNEEKVDETEINESLQDVNKDLDLSQEKTEESKPAEEKPNNPYLSMPIEKVKSDAEHGVALAKEALEVRQSEDQGSDVDRNDEELSDSNETALDPEKTTQELINENRESIKGIGGNPQLNTTVSQGNIDDAIDKFGLESDEVATSKKWHEIVKRFEEGQKENSVKSRRENRNKKESKSVKERRGRKADKSKIASSISTDLTPRSEKSSLDDFLRDVVGARFYNANGSDYGTARDKVTESQLELAREAYRDYLDNGGKPFKEKAVDLELQKSVDDAKEALKYGAHNYRGDDFTVEDRPKLIDDAIKSAVNLDKEFEKIRNEKNGNEKPIANKAKEVRENNKWEFAINALLSTGMTRKEVDSAIDQEYQKRFNRKRPDSEELVQRREAKQAEFDRLAKEESKEAKFSEGDISIGDTVTYAGGSFEVTEINEFGVAGKSISHIPYSAINEISKPAKKSKDDVKEHREKIKQSKNVEKEDNEKSTKIDDSTKSKQTDEQKQLREEEQKSSKSQEKIEDFGEVIPEARKHIIQDYYKSFAPEDADLKSLPLSKVFPKPDYKKLVKSGEDPKVVAFIRAVREEIPNKPRVSYKLEAWISKVKNARDMIKSISEGEVNIDDLIEQMKKGGGPIRGFLRVPAKIQLHAEFGHDIDLSKLTVDGGHFSIYNGKRLDKPQTKYIIQNGRYRSESSADGNTYDEALQAFKEKIMPKILDKPKETSKKKGPKFNVFKRTFNTEGKARFVLGVQIGKDIIELAESNDAVELRKMMRVEYDSLVAKLEEMKKHPELRRKYNEPRLGGDFRDGADVSSDQFQSAFGFRGVQFGNSMTQKERQNHLNETYDSLMDLATLLNVDPKALTLNGALGIAFGARGRGGKNPASAHFEPDHIAINLTRKAGAGSLAHEWFHALDNHFGRQGKKSDFQSQIEGNSDVRMEITAAFNVLMDSIMDSAMLPRAMELDKMRSKPYWSTRVEMVARSFESYVISKLNQQGFSNDYLANINNDPDSWDGKYPYLLKEEIPKVEASFDLLFDKMDSRKTDTGIEIYRQDDYVDPDVVSKSFSELSESDKEIVMDIVKTMTGGKDVRFAEQLFDDVGQEVFGRYKDQFIEISEKKGDWNDTARHEAMHFVYDLLLTEKERLQFDIDTDQLGLTHEQVIEKVNEFARENTGSTANKIKRWARKMTRRVRSLFGADRAIDRLNEIYDQSLSGKLADRGVTGQSNYQGQNELFRSEEALDNSMSKDAKKVIDSWDFKDVAKSFIENMKKDDRNAKVDIGTSRFFRNISFFSEAIPAMKRLFDAGNKLRDDKVMIERLMFNEDNGNGSSNFESLAEFSKSHKKEWEKLSNDYLWKRDRDQAGYSVKEYNGSFTLVDPKNKDVAVYSSESEAWANGFRSEYQDMIKAGWSNEAANAVLDVRKMMSRQHDLLSDSLNKLEKEAKELGIQNPTIGEVKLFDLRAELKKMGDLRGSYMPRLRTGRFLLWAKKSGENPRLETFDTKIGRSARAAILEKQGYQVNFEVSNQPSQDAFLQGGNISAIEDLVNNSLIRADKENNGLDSLDVENEVVTYKDKAGSSRNNLIVKGENAKKYALVLESFGATREGDTWVFKNKSKSKIDLIQKSLAGAMHNFNGKKVLEFEAVGKALAEQMAVMFHSKGSQSRKISRDGRKGSDVYMGFEEDALKALSMSITATAGGTAKRNMTKSMIEAISGRDLKWQEYLKENIDPSIKEGSEAYYDAKIELWPQYREAVIERSIQSDKQPQAFKESLSYMQDMQRNEEGSERIMGRFRAFAAFKYLSSFSSGLINLTALPTVAPGAMSTFAGIKFKQAMRLLPKAAKDYTKYMMYHKFGKGEDLKGEDKFIYDEIVKRGWDADLMNQEAMGVTRTWGGKITNTIMETGMFVFGVTEKVNRASMIAASYKGMVENHTGELTDADREKYLDTAKRVSDKANGVYGKANLPSVARGSSIGGQTLRSAYMFRTYLHNYLQLLHQVGFKEKDLKSFAWILLSPAIIGGTAATVPHAIVTALAGMTGVAEPEEIEEEFYKYIREYAGENAEDLARFGLAGQAGISLKGSLAIGTELPTKITDLFGASYSAVNDFATGVGQIASGETQKGFESALPRILSNVLKSQREYSEGVTNSRNQPIYFGNERVKASGFEFLARFFGFNPVRIAEIREKQWKDSKIERKYSEEKSEIYKDIRRFLLDGGSKADWIEHLKIIDDYNARVNRSGNTNISQITQRSIRGVIQAMKKGNRREALRAKEISGETEEREIPSFENFNIEDEQKDKSRSVRSRRQSRRSRERR